MFGGGYRGNRGRGQDDRFHPYARGPPRGDFRGGRGDFRGGRGDFRGGRGGDFRGGRGYPRPFEHNGRGQSRGRGYGFSENTSFQEFGNNSYENQSFNSFDQTTQSNPVSSQKILFYFKILEFKFFGFSMGEFSVGTFCNMGE